MYPTGPGFTLRAGNVINIDSDGTGSTTIGDGIILETGNLPSRFSQCDLDPLPPVATQSDVTSVCTNLNLYNPNIATKTQVSASMEESNALNLRARPNPTEGWTTLEFSLRQARDVSVSVLDLTGRLVLPAEAKGILEKGPNQISVNLHDLSPGMYQIVLKMDDKLHTVKVVKNQ
ncbi:MAG: T9SS type A sorting domain-containing protein [Bacteroidota bacterium]